MRWFFCGVGELDMVCVWKRKVVVELSDLLGKYR